MGKNVTIHAKKHSANVTWNGAEDFTLTTLDEKQIHFFITCPNYDYTFLAQMTISGLLLNAEKFDNLPKARKSAFAALDKFVFCETMCKTNFRS